MVGEDKNSTLVDVLRRRAENQGDRLAYIFLIDGDNDEVRINYKELDLQARAIGAFLQGLNAWGERTLLLFVPGLEYIAAFFGSLYAGAIAVPAYPPDPTRLSRTLPRLQAIVKDSGAKFVLTTQPILQIGKTLFAQAPQLKNLHWIAIDDLNEDKKNTWKDPMVKGEDLAFLQYTSGSTAAPKGVMISYNNLNRNADYLNRIEGNPQNRLGVFWLPMYHDMGLIGGILQSMFCGNTNVLMSPMHFLQRPMRWLRAFTKYRGDHSAAPNFAFDLCVRKVTPEQRRDLDLSSWKIAYNGAEPIRRETIEKFTEIFGPCGFRAETMYPCYGLAEATLIASGGSLEEGPKFITVQREALQKNQVVLSTNEDKNSQDLVDSGRAKLDHEILIVDPETLTECPSQRVGEIWLAGPNIGKGYWNNGPQTQETFQAHLKNSDSGPYLRTGDLGFLKDGELFVTGRLKDLIILTGQNHYAQDIELTVEKVHPALRPGCGAAFSISTNGEERLVVVQEIDTRQSIDLDSVKGKIRQALVETHDVDPYRIILIEPKSIFKTSSGKIQRSYCRESFLDGTLSELRV